MTDTSCDKRGHIMSPVSPRCVVCGVFSSQMMLVTREVHESLTARLAAAEAALETEKDRRIHWQGLAYIGMRVIDKVLANRITLGEGTTEESMQVNARMAMDKYTWLFNENKELRKAAKGGQDE